MSKQAEAFVKKYKIAGTIVALESDFSFDYSNLKPFEISSEELPDLKIRAFHHDLTDVRENFGASILSSPYMYVHECNNVYRFYYKNTPDIHYCEYDSVNHTADIVILNKAKDSAGFKDFTFEDHLFYALRDAFFFFCQQHGMIALHSSSIVYNGRAYLFSAPSGTGKTTHTNLWEEYCDVKPLNGDVAMLSVQDGVVYVHGIPWCGTSEKYSNVTVPLGNIIFLKRAGSNEISPMSSFEAVLNICSRSFSPNWNKSLGERTLNVAKEIVEKRPCLLLKCLPEKSAMELVKDYIDTEKSR